MILYRAKFVWRSFEGYRYIPRGRMRINVHLPAHPESEWDIDIYLDHIVELEKEIEAPIGFIRYDLDLASIGDSLIVYSLTKNNIIRATGTIVEKYDVTLNEFRSILHFDDEYGTL